jgi:CRP/FNR family cyclic AMP-dependent transcriptional regulator
LALKDAGLLAHVALFEGLDEKQWQALSEQLHQKTYPGGTHIITAEQPGEVVFIILSGAVKIYMDQVDGSTVILAILGPGDIVGEMSLIDSAGRSASVVTLEDANLLWLDRQAFQYYLQRIPQLNANLVRILSKRVRLANEHIQALAALDVYGRLARQFLAFAEKYGEGAPGEAIRIPLRLTQSDLADLVGASRKRVNQVMVAYKRSGYLSVDAEGYITVHQRQELARHCR